VIRSAWILIDFIVILRFCYCLVLNSELMQQLVDRDDLHMAQDSMLVDIEDLTGSVAVYTL